jgi:hypothetical protein
MVESMRAQRLAKDSFPSVLCHNEIWSDVLDSRRCRSADTVTAIAPKCVKPPPGTNDTSHLQHDRRRIARDAGVGLGR